VHYTYSTCQQSTASRKPFRRRSRTKLMSFTYTVLAEYLGLMYCRSHGAQILGARAPWAPWSRRLCNSASCSSSLRIRTKRIFFCLVGLPSGGENSKLCCFWISNLWCRNLAAIWESWTRVQNYRPSPIQRHQNRFCTSLFDTAEIAKYNIRNGKTVIVTFVCLKVLNLFVPGYYHHFNLLK